MSFDTDACPDGVRAERGRDDVVAPPALPLVRHEVVPAIVTGCIGAKPLSHRDAVPSARPHRSNDRPSYDRSSPTRDH